MAEMVAVLGLAPNGVLSAGVGGVTYSWPVWAP
jgi:hypothetical protein